MQPFNKNENIRHYEIARLERLAMETEMEIGPARERVKKLEIALRTFRHRARRGAPTRLQGINQNVSDHKAVHLEAGRLVCCRQKGRLGPTL